MTHQNIQTNDTYKKNSQIKVAACILHVPQVGHQSHRMRADARMAPNALILIQLLNVIAYTKEKKKSFTGA